MALTELTNSERCSRASSELTDLREAIKEHIADLESEGGDTFATESFLRSAVRSIIGIQDFLSLGDVEDLQ